MAKVLPGELTMDWSILFFSESTLDEYWGSSMGCLKNDLLLLDRFLEALYLRV
jgi:hypothetical protein